MPSVKIFLERENITKKVNAVSIEEIMKKLNINPEVVIISKNNELVTKKAIIHDGDEIKFLSVVSGG